MTYIPLLVATTLLLGLMIAAVISHVIGRRKRPV